MRANLKGRMRLEDENQLAEGTVIKNNRKRDFVENKRKRQKYN